MLSLDDFKQLVSNAPLFAIDLVVINERNEILLGQRKNAPAKGYWFVPGGRVYKNEALETAIERISQSELGLTLKRHELNFIGLYDHFYDDSFFDENTSTHYINATHYIRLNAQLLNLPTEQHAQYRWVALNQLEEDDAIHRYSKIFLTTLNSSLTDNANHF